jgi:hypothetical protein
MRRFEGPWVQRTTKAHFNDIEKESTMKRIIQGLAFAALVSGAPAVWSEWNFNDADSGSSIPAQSTYADRHANEPVQLFGFASLADADAGSILPAQSTRADRYAEELGKAVTQTAALSE